MRWTFTFDLVANADFRAHMISVYFANAWTTRIKIKIEPSFTQRESNMLACPKTPRQSLNILSPCRYGEVSGRVRYRFVFSPTTA